MPHRHRARAAARAAGTGPAAALEALWTTEHGPRQPADTGTGHPPRPRDAPHTTLLICDEDTARQVTAAIPAAGADADPGP
ncbi:hypothetical protein ACIBCA_20365 [Kitasatospora sp. NPDC051170]|uniref:hypothetical protein n=1 Tax=Kitasatospora sp. NPDC051170 TaxID=3364056 RepID=UPI0037984288